MATAEVLINMGSRRVVQPTTAAVAVVEATSRRHARTGMNTKEWFEACQQNGRVDHAGILDADVNGYVRNKLFRKLKFVMSEQQMNYSREKGSFCLTICEGVGVCVENEAIMVSWWEAYKKSVVVIMNQKRADVTSAVKTCFQSKYKWQIQKRKDIILTNCVVFCDVCRGMERNEKRRQERRLSNNG